MAYDEEELERQQRKDYEEKRKLSKYHHEQRRTVFTTLLASADGREFLWWLLSLCRVFQTPYARNALDTSFNCGEHNVGLKLLNEITEANPEGLVRMMQEKMQHEQNPQKRVASVRAGRSPEPSAGTESES